MKNLPLPRLDQAPELRQALLRYCRLRPGEIRENPRGRHRVGCLDAAETAQARRLVGTCRPIAARSFLTMRNQRGYGTQRNWMAVRQELLYCTLGSPVFRPEAEYTDIPSAMQEMFEVVRQRAIRDVKLPLAHVSLVLPSGVTDVRADPIPLDTENQDAVFEEDAVVQNIELGPIDLLDIAVECAVLETSERNHAFRGCGIFDAAEHRLRRDLRFRFFGARENFTSGRLPASRSNRS